MIESISKIFSLFPSMASTAQTWKELLKGTRGDTRALLEEIKENLRLCWLVIELKTDPAKVLNEFKTIEYDRLARAGFNFDRIKKGKIKTTAKIKNSDLSFLTGRSTGYLIENIYDRIKEIKTVQRVDPDNKNIDWKRRIFNLQKRLLLFTQHLRS
jgi:hypothetical protein